MIDVQFDEPVFSGAKSSEGDGRTAADIEAERDACGPSCHCSTDEEID